jgi:polygalacturonase
MTTMPFPPHTRRTFLSRIAAAAFACTTSTALSQPRVVNLGRRGRNAKDFGAVGDGAVLDTAAIQRAINDTARAGGGTVTFPAGDYVTGTLLLKDRVTVQLEAGATLLGSLDPAHYKLVEPFTDGVGTTRGYALIAAVDVEEAAILGPGTIDGRGAQLHAGAPNSPAGKPFLVLAARSHAVRFHNLKLCNSAAWTMHIFQSTQVTIDNVSIRSLGLANNDGIDIDSSREVRVTGCTIESGDDAICLKTTSPTPCRDITISNCTMTTRCAAFKIGTESAGDFSNIRLSDCHVIEANLGAVKLLSVDGANISDVAVERMQVDDADTPIFLRLGDRGRTFRSGDVARPAGTLSRITIRDFTVRRARRTGILISGIPGHPVKDVALERINITMAGDAVRLLPPTPPESPAAYPEVCMFGAALPASGLYARHIVSLTCADVKVVTVPGDIRPERLIAIE